MRVAADLKRLSITGLTSLEGIYTFFNVSEEVQKMNVIFKVKSDRKEMEWELHRKREENWFQD